MIEGLSSSPLNYQKPVGESGTQVQGATEHNSVIRVYAFEAQHQAAQRRQAKKNGVDVKTQDIQIKVKLDDSGKPIAIGAQTTTDVKDASGNTAQINELALLSEVDRGDYLAASAFFGDSKKSLPQLFLFDAFASRYNIENRRRQLDITKNSEPLRRSIFDNLRSSTDELDAITRVEKHLSSLRTSVDKLLGSEPFNNKAVSIDIEGAVTAKTLSSEAAAGISEIEVISEARSQQVAFDVVGRDDVAFGLSGEFKINGVALQLKDTDTLIQLRDLINYGEDVNRNGRLDNNEDFNINGKLDPGEDHNNNGRLDTDEDADRDGVLDDGEDLNYNGKLDLAEDRDYDGELDLGTEEHGVKAFIIDNVLILESVETDGRIDIEDEDGILESLGLIEDNIYGDTVFKNVLFEGSQAVVEKDGERFTSSTNVMTNVIEGVELNILAPLQKQIKVEVEADAEILLNTLNDVVGAFNAVQEEMNDHLDLAGIFRDDAHLRQQKIDFINAFRFEESPPPEVLTSLEEFGISQERQRVALHEMSIIQASERLKSGQLSPFDNVFGVPTVRNSIGHFAITDEKDGALSIDEEVLREKIETDPETAEKHIGSDGFAGRLDASLNRALSDYGHIAFTKNTIQNRENSSTAEILENVLRSQPRQPDQGSQVNLLA